MSILKKKTRDALRPDEVGSPASSPKTTRRSPSVFGSNVDQHLLLVQWVDLHLLGNRYIEEDFGSLHFIPLYIIFVGFPFLHVV